MIKKVVISPDKKDKAVAFFEDVNRKKEETVKRIEEKTAGIKEVLNKKTVGK